ncbi:MAG: Asp-tRNA(Asn)/Glu-tRNA(Gln) amidotransferase GatCAB subunit C, partial [Chloroflexi bacterium]|nr:Asp-tRNA(Asn)/Glu-tRNA(Gln) amidotransferase GatCAB subunit C [Chloroflexota bacterium]
GGPPTTSVADRLHLQEVAASIPAMERDQVLANAPQREDEYFRVHAVLDQS